MESKIKFTGVIVIMLVLLGLFYLIKNQILDTFIVFLDEKIIPKNCFNYLLTDGKNFYLLDTHRIYDDTNPLIFNTKKEAQDYLKNQNCEVNIPFVNLLVKKKKDDPTVSYERECNKNIAPHLFDLDVCNTYGSDLDMSSAVSFAELNKIESDNAQYANYDQETCMIDRAVKENPELDDKNFKKYFSQYFDRMNSNIDEQFLYITSN